jgi:hypothetical protein
MVHVRLAETEGVACQDSLEQSFVVDPDVPRSVTVDPDVGRLDEPLESLSEL